MTKYYIDSDYLTTALEGIADRYKEIIVNRDAEKQELIDLRVDITDFLVELEVEYHLLLYRDGRGRRLPKDYEDTYYYLQHLLEAMRDSIDLDKPVNEPFTRKVLGKETQQGE